MQSMKDKGFTLIELMVTIAVAAILLTIGVPSFTEMIDRNHLKGAAEGVYSDFQFARAEAIKRNKIIRVSFSKNDDGSTWCYGLKEAANCDCTETDPAETDFCEIDNIPKVVSSTSFNGVTLVNMPFGGTASFTPLRGTVNTGNVELQSSKGKQLKLVVSGLGRVRLCSPSGTGNISGYPIC